MSHSQYLVSSLMQGIFIIIMDVVICVYVSINQCGVNEWEC